MTEGQRTDGERMATLEEQVRGMRHDFNDFKQEMKQTVQTFFTLHKEYMPRIEAEREDAEIRKEIEDLKTEVRRLAGRPTWTVAGVFTGSIAVIAVLITVITAYMGKH